MMSISSADFAHNNPQPANQHVAMQSNPTSNGQGAGGVSSLTSGVAQGAGPSAAAASNNPLADGGGMFGAATTATETLGGRRQAATDG